MADNRRGARSADTEPLDTDEQPQSPEEPTPTYYVAAHPSQGDRVALWDVDKAHPNGEVLVAAPSGPCEVAETPAVLQALRDGRLVKVNARQAQAWHKEQTERRDEARAQATGVWAMALEPGRPVDSGLQDQVRELSTRLERAERELASVKASTPPPGAGE